MAGEQPLTAQERRWVELMAGGTPPQEAARLAGLPDPIGHATLLMTGRSPRVMAEVIAALQLKALSWAVMKDRAKRTLHDAQDESVPWPARIRAAIAILATIREFGSLDDKAGAEDRAERSLVDIAGDILGAVKRRTPIVSGSKAEN